MPVELALPSASALTADLVVLAQVLMIDLMLAGDNAVAVGLAASGLEPHKRRAAILAGLGAAVALRITFAVLATRLLAVIGLTLAGGLILLWVCWKMWRELHAHSKSHAPGEVRPAKSFASALTQICWPTCRCRWTTCWRSPARRATTRRCWCSGFCCRSP